MTKTTKQLLPIISALAAIVAAYYACRPPCTEGEEIACWDPEKRCDGNKVCGSDNRYGPCVCKDPGTGGGGGAAGGGGHGGTVSSVGGHPGTGGAPTGTGGTGGADEIDCQPNSRVTINREAWYVRVAGYREGRQADAWTPKGDVPGEEVLEASVALCTNLRNEVGVNDYVVVLAEPIPTKAAADARVSRARRQMAGTKALGKSGATAQIGNQLRDCTCLGRW